MSTQQKRYRKVKRVQKTQPKENQPKENQPKEKSGFNKHIAIHNLNPNNKIPHRLLLTAKEIEKVFSDRKFTKAYPYRGYDILEAYIYKCPCCEKEIVGNYKILDIKFRGKNCTDDDIIQKTIGVFVVCIIGNLICDKCESSLANNRQTIKTEKSELEKIHEG